MRKPTVLVVLDEAMTAVQRTEVTNVIQQSNEFAAYTVQVTPTKLSQTSFGVDPWSVINSLYDHSFFSVFLAHSQYFVVTV